ncbi:MAG TPA: PAS domain S-box protein, partial [Bacteroidales bacterium]|nr:PAS domain S-box protein [Bacteroidales bacterium]
IIFDGRSIVISLCALFFGPVSGIITSVMALVYRIILGGSGTVMGSMVIASSFLIGYYFHQKRVKPVAYPLTWINLYLFGIWVHAAMLLFVFALPGKFILEAYQAVALTVIGIYPVISLLIGKILPDEENNKVYIDRIRERESLYRTTLYSIGDAVITTDIHGRIRQMNQIAEQLTGWKEIEAENIPIEKVFNSINETDRSKAQSPLDKVLQGGSVDVLSDHTLLISRNGKEVPVADSGSPIRLENGSITGMVLVFRDQTEERRIQRALMESEERYRKLLEMAPAGIALYSENKISFINPAGAQLLGSDSSGKIIGRPLESILHPSGNGESVDRFHRMMAGEKGLYPAEDIFIRLDGSTMDVEVMASPLTFKGEQATQFIFIDISQRKKAELEIKSLNAELEQGIEERTIQLMETNKELEAYTYSVSHDLRAPLRAIDGFARFLMEDYSNVLDDEGKKIVQVIRQNSKRMGQLIDDLLRFSRLSRVEMRFSTVQMKPLVDSVYLEITGEELRKRIHFTVEELMDAKGDEAMIRQVWTNLISNAVKYTAHREPATVTITSKSEDDRVVYCIRDNGAGFDMKYAGKLFGVFQRMHSTREFEGTGIGLAIVKQVIQRMGGKVWAEAEVDRGAAFYFSLPV